MDTKAPQTAAAAQRLLRQHASPAAAERAARFFKTGPGQTDAGVRFLGVGAAPLRQLAKSLRRLPLPEAEKLLQSPWHEDRALSLLILVEQFPRADAAGQEDLVELYLKNAHRVNNWALVDCSAPGLLGAWLLGQRDRSLLDRLAGSKLLWERRIAMVATQHLIRRGMTADAFRLARLLLDDAEDLIHKASGWMLREAGQKEPKALASFLDRHAAVMPRTMLRYAIEKLPEPKRRAYLQAKRRAKRKRPNGGKP